MFLALENQHIKKKQQTVKSLIVVLKTLSVPTNCLTLQLVFKKICIESFTCESRWSRNLI